MKDKLLVTVAPSIPAYMAVEVGNLDLSPEGIADEVVRAWNAGASIAHLHVWDENGKPTTDLTAFRRTVDLIRERCDILIEGSTGGVNELTPRERSVCLETDVEMASLNLGSVNYDAGVYINSPSDIAYWVQRMKAKNIKPNSAIFEAGMITNAIEWIDAGMIAKPYLFTFVLGQKGAMPADPRNLLFLIESLPESSIWSVAGHGGADLSMGVLSLALGGHVRAGFEDNPYYLPGEVATSNAQLIERLVRIAEEVGREVASPSEAREMLGLSS